MLLTASPPHLRARSETFPVYNVSVPVIGRAFWLFELDARAPGRTQIN